MATERITEKGGRKLIVLARTGSVDQADPDRRVLVCEDKPGEQPVFAITDPVRDREEKD